MFPLVSVLTLLLGSASSSAGQTATQGQSPFLGSVPAAEAVPGTLPLSLEDVFSRALRYNLGLIEGDQNTRAAQAPRLRNLSALLPDVSASVSATREQINLKAEGFNVSIPASAFPRLWGHSPSPTLA